MLHEINIQSRKRDEMINIPGQVQRIIVESKVQDGLVIIFCSHTTAGITINENADPDVQKDFISVM